MLTHKFMWEVVATILLIESHRAIHSPIKHLETNTHYEQGSEKYLKLFSIIYFIHHNSL